MIYEFKGFKPVIHESSYIHQQACIIGNVIIGANVYIGPFATLRGDIGGIVIEDGSNIQESCTIHMFPGVEVRLGENAHIGHGAIVHGATIGKNCLIGMNAVVMDNVVIGDECVVGALTFIKANSVFENRKLIVGNPARVLKDITDDMIDWKTKGTQLYQQLVIENHETLKECEPLRSIPDNRPAQDHLYQTWNEIKKQ
ncbi:MAG: transferase hexapeptide repeat family protein [Bacteroidota bacterium]